MSVASVSPSRRVSPVARLLRLMGPGFITGASDADPSVPSVWTARVTFPLMAAVQLIGARTGRVSGMGWAGVLRQHKWLVLALLAALGGPAHAAPNGLTQIPIAKVFGDGVGAFSLAHSQLDTTSSIYTAQYGLWNWLELGVDYQAAPRGQRTPLGNLKVLLLHQPHHTPDVAAGIQNVAIGQEAVPYLVATSAPWAPDSRGRGAPGLSLGVIRPAGSGYQLLAGLSYNLSANLQLVADGITGPQSYRTLGVLANLSKEITLNLAYAQPNDSAKNPRGFIFNLAYTIHLKGRGQQQGGPREKNPSPGGEGNG